MIHNDFHGRNILVQKVEKGGYWTYVIDGIKYYVPNYGYVFLISDFGYSWIPDIMYPKDYVTKHIAPASNSENEWGLPTIYYTLQDSMNTKLTTQSIDTWDLVKLKRLTIDPILKESKKKGNGKEYFLNDFLPNLDKLIESEESGNVSPINTIIKTLFGSNYKELCDKYPFYCYSEKNVKGKNIETYDLNKKINKSKLHKNLQKLVLL